MGNPLASGRDVQPLSEAASSVVVSDDGKNVYVATAGDDAVAVFSRDIDSGELVFVEAQIDGVGGVDGLNGAWAIDVSPDGQQVYAAGFIDRAVVHFNRDPSDGALTFVERHVNGTGGIAGLEDP